MARLLGYGGRFGLRCWRDRCGAGPPHLEEASDDEAALREVAKRLLGAGAYHCIVLSAWNFELNDWIRLETFTG